MVLNTPLADGIAEDEETVTLTLREPAGPSSDRMHSYRVSEQNSATLFLRDATPGEFRPNLSLEARNGALELGVAALDGPVCDVEVSTDLANWRSLENVLSGLRVDLKSLQLDTNKVRFFRARVR